MSRAAGRFPAFIDRKGEKSTKVAVFRNEIGLFPNVPGRFQLDGKTAVNDESCGFQRAWGISQPVFILIGSYPFEAGQALLDVPGVLTNCF